MSKNFFEIKDVDFNVSGKTKVKDVSFSIENKLLDFSKDINQSGVRCCSK